MLAPDIAAFWQETRTQLDRIPLDVVVAPAPEQSGREYQTFRVTMTSYDGIRIRAWYSVPKNATPRRRYPAVLATPGYGGDKPIPVALVQTGYAVLTLFPRGQGESRAEWELASGTKLTSCLADREQYYYRGAYMDSVRGVDFLTAQPEVDPGRIAAWGRSQGGGLTLAVAALDHRLAAAVAEEPFLCNFPVAVHLISQPYRELHDYLADHPREREASMATLAFFDPMELVDAVTCPTLVNIGLSDQVCPQETILPVFARLRCLKGLLVYPGLDHNPCTDFTAQGMNWLVRHVG
ncbi:MAG: acetylxylan esterase [Chloroflexi bacterium]|nr:acetylxylan esterase [Chloroflexota bacterium]